MAPEKVKEIQAALVEAYRTGAWLQAQDDPTPERLRECAEAYAEKEAREMTDEWAWREQNNV